MKKILIQYQAPQILTKKNSLTKMNRQFWKIETPHNQATHSQIPNQTTQRKRLHKNKNVNLETLWTRKRQPYDH